MDLEFVIIEELLTTNHAFHLQHIRMIMYQKSLETILFPFVAIRLGAFESCIIQEVAIHDFEWFQAFEASIFRRTQWTETDIASITGQLFRNHNLFTKITLSPFKVAVSDKILTRYRHGKLFENVLEFTGSELVGNLCLEGFFKFEIHN